MKRKPRIAIALDIGRSAGRAYLRGVVAFIEKYGCWDCDFFLLESSVAHVARYPLAVDGMIISSDPLSAPSKHEARVSFPFPVVAVGYRSAPGFPSVCPDSDAIGRLAAEHLVERGMRRFAYLAYDDRFLFQSQGEPFRQALRSLGYSCDWLEVSDAFGAKAWVPVDARMLSWLKRLKKPVGIFCAGDYAARELARVCLNAGIDVPGEVAILGVNNDEFRCLLCRPELSSVDPNGQAAGYEAAGLLQRMLKRQKVSTEPVIVAPGRVVVRLSTDIIAADDPHIARAVRYIRENLAEGVNVKQLVRHMEMGRRTLELAFRKHLGRTVHGEIVRAALQRACQLLTEEDQPLAKVAADCGIRHQSHLSAFFKKNMGMTPLEYRKKYQRKRF